MYPHGMLRLELSCSRSLPAEAGSQLTELGRQRGFRLQAEEEEYFCRNFFILSFRLALSDDM